MFCLPGVLSPRCSVSQVTWEMLRIRCPFRVRQCLVWGLHSPKQTRNLKSSPLTGTDIYWEPLFRFCVCLAACRLFGHGSLYYKTQSVCKNAAVYPSRLQGVEKSLYRHLLQEASLFAEFKRHEMDLVYEPSMIDMIRGQNSLQIAELGLQ